MDSSNYIAPYELPWWVQSNVPSEYMDKPWMEGINPLSQEPAMIEEVFSTLRKNYPYLHDFLVDKGVQVGLPSQERFMRMYEKTGEIPDMTPGGEDLTRQTNTLGIYDPNTLMMLLTLHPNYRNIALHEGGHAAIKASPTWQDILDKMPITGKQQAAMDMAGYPVEESIQQLNPDSMKLLDFLNPSWRRDIKEEIALRGLFPVLEGDKEPLTKDQQYITNALSNYLKYGSNAGDFK